MLEAGVESRRLAEALNSAANIEPAPLIEKFLRKIEMHQEGIRLVVSLSPLLQSNDQSVSLTREIPMHMKRRGVEVRMIIGDIVPKRANPVLVKTLARALSWYEEFASGRAATLAEIASRHKVDKGYVSRVVSLAFLAPDIVEDIVAGRQPADLTAQRLLRQTQLPLDWADQKRLLGYRGAR